MAEDREEGQMPRGRNPVKKPKWKPFVGREELPQPAGYDEKGIPYAMKGKERVTFAPEPRYAVEDGCLVAYTIGRGGLKKRGLMSLNTMARKGEKYERNKALRKQLKEARIPGA